jgi:hypothetical protein
MYAASVKKLLMSGATALGRLERGGSLVRISAFPATMQPNTMNPVARTAWANPILGIK